jgi:hypothetical protein
MGSTSASCRRRPSSPERKSFCLDLSAHVLILFACAGLAGCNSAISSMPPPGNGSAPTITSFSADPESINSGSSSMLSWATSGATSIAITPGTFTSTSVSGSTSVSPTATTTYTLTATNAAGSVTSTQTVTVNTASIPTISSFTANPTSINPGSSSMLSWATSGATSIAVTPGTFTSTSASGLTSVSPTATTTYTLTATNTTGSVTSTLTVTVNTASIPTISSFAANPTSINPGSSSTLSWATSGAASIAIAPGTFTSTSASGSTSVSPTATTTYTLTATNATGSTTSTAIVTVTAPGGPLAITTTSCPGGTQGAAYAGCTIAASGGTPPYTYSLSSDVTDYPPLPEGMSLNASTGNISSSLIGGQGTYIPELVVTDSTGAQATQDISFAINGSNAFLASIFPSTSIFHHRVDAATTGLPVDTSPAAPIYSAYLPETIKPFFGDEYANFPNGIPAIEVPYNQPVVSVTTTGTNAFTSGPIPPYAPVEGTANSTGDRHVLVYLEAGGGNNPALYEMYQGIYEGGPWTDSGGGYFSNVSSNGMEVGISDAAGLPVGPLLVNADEVIGTGTPSAPNGVIQHPIRFTLNHMVNYWVWPGTATAGVGNCTAVGGAVIPTFQLLSQSSPPASCTMSGPAGEIYRLMASVATPACALTSPQANVIITAFRSYGIILADNGQSGGLIGTPDARWNNNDLACLRSLILSDFEPVNVSSIMVSSGSGATSH